MRSFQMTLLTRARARGQFPTDPFLVNGPFIDHELLNQRFPPGTRLRNTGVVVFDSPDRKQPFAHQFTVGYVRELASSLAVHADYVHIANKQLFLSRNLNPMVRADTTRTGAITRVDAFGVLGEPYSQQVWVFENSGESVYDAINLQLEKRYADGWSARVSYSLSYSRGTATSQNARNTDQFLTDLRLDKRWGPTAVDRRHILSISARTEIPKTGGATLATVVRYMTGAPFTHFRQRHRRRSERRARRSASRRHLQRDGPERDDERDSTRVGAMARMGPITFRSIQGRVAAPDREEHAGVLRGRVQHHEPDELREPRNTGGTGG